jgi:hypothetical protein
MTRAQLTRLETAAREAMVQPVLGLVRQARPERQPALLRSRLEGLDRLTRQAVYRSLTTSELEALAGPESAAYVTGLSDTEIRTLVQDRSGAEAARRYRTYQRWHHEKEHGR